MTLTWRDGSNLELPRPGVTGLVRATVRFVPLLLVLGVGVLVVALLRPPERLIFEGRRPVTSWVTVAVCRAALRLLGLRQHVQGVPLSGPGAFVANHSSWLDIFALNAQGPMTFVAKSEVAGWPGIGWLARATGTVFVRREARAQVAEQARALAERLRSGARLTLFPEGTSTDNRRVLPFRSALLSGLLAPDLSPDLRLQPVTLAYEAPAGQDPRFYAWYGDAEFGPHALAVLAAPRGGRVRVTFHDPIPVAGRNRKSLAAEAERRVRAAL